MSKKILLLFCITISFACNTKNEKLTNVVILIDFSKSISPLTLEWYKEVVKKEVIIELDEKDQITVLPIDYGSSTGSIELLHANLAEKTFKYLLDSPINADKKIKTRKEKYLKEIAIGFDSTFNYSVSARVKYSLGTDVLGVLKQANKYYTINQNNLLIVFSDMINETEELDLNKNLTNQSDIQTILQKITVPQYGKWDIIIMTGDQPGMKIQKYHLLQKFWEEYFLKTNINMADYQSGGVSILKKKLKEYKTAF